MVQKAPDKIKLARTTLLFLAVCSACHQSVPVKRISPADWLRYGLTRFDQAGIDYLCNNCRIDIEQRGKWTGVGWAWVMDRRGIGE